MKLIFLLPVFMVAQLASAQQTCELKFHFIVYDSTRAVGDTAFIHIAQTNKKFAVNYRDYDLEERFILDSSAQKVVELTNQYGTKKAFVADLKKDDGYGFTTAYDFAEEGRMDRNSYRLLEDKKTIHGLDCRKIAFFDRNGIVSSGWVALGLYIGYSEDSFFRVEEGSIIEYVLADKESLGSITLKLEAYSKTIKNMKETFSLKIPGDYELNEPVEE